MHARLLAVVAVVMLVGSAAALEVRPPRLRVQACAAQLPLRLFSRGDIVSCLLRPRCVPLAWRRLSAAFLACRAQNCIKRCRK
jgi:hypothetical protein